MNWAAIAWLVLILLFLGMEGATVSVISLWFAVGALAALIVSFFASVAWQVVVFLVVSCLLLAALRPIVRKYFKPRIVKTNVDAVIGAMGLVTADIDNISACGEVKLGSVIWSARSTSGQPITNGKKIRVDRVEGVKVFVSEVETTVKI